MYNLRKLPMWGQQVSLEAINFEWPTQGMFDKMPPSVSLKWLEISTSNQNDPAVAAVRVAMTNEQKSRHFLKDDVQCHHTKLISPKADRKIAAIEAQYDD